MQKNEIIEAVKSRHKFLRSSVAYFQEHWTEQDFARDVSYRVGEVSHLLNHVPCVAPARVLEVGVGGGPAIVLPFPDGIRSGWVGP